MTESRIERPLRILIADSAAPFKKAAGEALAERGFTVELAGTPDQTFQMVRSHQPDILFYDLDMPGYEGLEALILITKMRAAKKSYVIAAAARSAADLNEKALAAGAWEFVHKPLALKYVLDTSAAIKRHVRRAPLPVRQPDNKALKAVSHKCARSSCNTTVTGLLLKENTMVARPDQFETPIYLEAVGNYDFVDYNLISVTVCPRCYHAVDEAAARSAGARVLKPTAAPRPLLLRIAAEADDTLFSENRSPQAALVALALAIENQKACARDDSPEDESLLSDLVFKATAVAHLAGDERARDALLADAETICSSITTLEPCRQTYRAACRLVAIYLFFMREVDAARTIELLDAFAKPKSGRARPRDARFLQNYRAEAVRLFARRERYSRAHYLEGLTHE